MHNIEAKTNKTREDLWQLANKLGFVKDGKIVATHAQLLKWLKTDVGLGHVHANFIIMYFRLRTNDPKSASKCESGRSKQDTRTSDHHAVD